VTILGGWFAGGCDFWIYVLGGVGRSVGGCDYIYEDCCVLARILGPWGRVSTCSAGGIVLYRCAAG